MPSFTPNLINANPLHRSLLQRTARIHTLAVAAAFVLLGLVNNVLNGFYARSGFPVGYAEGQTTFNGAQLKEYYAVMSDQGTLGVYWQTQFVDFAFIAAMITFGLVAGSRLVRAADNSPALRSVAATGGAAVVLGGVFDAIENLISFVMLSRPADFANWIAIPYSAVAVAKFAAITIGLLGLAGSAIALGLRRVTTSRSLSVI